METAGPGSAGSGDEATAAAPYAATAGFIDTLRREGGRLADAAEGAGLDAPVPTCPEWRVRDLVAHTGAVHRWATAYVAEGRTEPEDWDETTPGDAGLVDWYREIHRGLADALSAAPADLTCWFFLTAPSALAFWARRQAHEVTIHRVDAEAACGRPPTPVEAAFAADGIDELLAGFHGRSRSRFRSDRPRSLRVRALDAPDGGDWLVRLSAEAPVVVHDTPEQPADCTVTGSAQDLYLALWNRGPYEKLTVAGDDGLLDLWRRTGAIT
ncbi:maleylpyruvate isomerase family mycothiol-dependent enzyme [Streptomyces sp. NPDC051976]|uniref:maleylpyruvate isomerase family mycothiol-dependent enzyme n=1 Tax=Streptomyces sp. NPDC051976 TaxID=3154947 RepID=UPI00343C5ADC